MDKEAVKGWLVWLESVKEKIESVKLENLEEKSKATFTLKTPDYKKVFKNE